MPPRSASATCAAEKQMRFGQIKIYRPLIAAAGRVVVALPWVVGDTRFMAADRSSGVSAAGHETRVEPGPGRQGPRELTAIIEREGDGYVALCSEVDVASQGNTVQEARTNLQEALELFFETASDSEIARRLRSEVYVTRVQVSVGTGRSAVVGTL